jgi:regulator of RNase E activity RraA
MTAGAIVRGARGVIISGRCRDMSEHHACSFPVFARGRSTLGQTPFTRPTAVNVPLEIKTGFEGLAGAEGDGGFPPCVWVQPGDWMVADEDGVVCVPTSLVEQVLDLAREGREVDTRCLVDIKNGTGVQESFRWHRGK